MASKVTGITLDNGPVPVTGRAITVITKSREVKTEGKLWTLAQDRAESTQSAALFAALGRA